MCEPLWNNNIGHESKDFPDKKVRCKKKTMIKVDDFRTSSSFSVSEALLGEGRG